MYNKFLGIGEKGYHPLCKVKVIKDISAAAAGLSILFWTLVMISESLQLWRAFHPL